MGSRLAGLVATFGVVTALVAGGIDPPNSGGPSELVYLGTQSGVTALNPDTGRSVFSAEEALPAGDWSLLVRAQPRGAKLTSVQAIDPATGRVLATTDLSGRLRVRVVSFDGRRVALMPRSYGGGLGDARGRAGTHIVVTGVEGTDRKVVDVDANLEPEAFSTDGRALFVLQYKPALHPDRYQVRRLDIETGQLSDIFTSDKDIQGDMQGIARTQALSPDGTRLYTLYTKGDHEAFVHVLSLDAQVANCVDLPKPFGQTPDAMALATSPDGRSLYVADTAHGRVADINTGTLKVKRTARLSAFPSTSGPAAVAASDSAVYVARGGKVSAFGTVSFHRYATWRFDSAVRGLQLADSGESELYVAERERVTILDGRDGNRLHRFPIPTADGISHVGYVLPQTSIGSYQCAC